MKNVEDTTFATLLNCMDGRVQITVNEKVREIFAAEQIDTITEAGIVRFLSNDLDEPETASALRRIAISLEKHKSKGIAIAAHHGCAGNAVDRATQCEQLVRAVAYLKEQFPGTLVTGLWANAEGGVEIEVAPLQ